MSRCWICFDDDAHDGWAKPCSCTLIAHEQCLLDWISETEKTAPYTAIRCPQCAMPYKIVDTVSTTLRMLWKVVYIVQIMIPVFTILCVSFTTLITSTAYGALTIIMFLGTEQSEQLMGPTVQWTWRTWATMPLIPMVLVACCFRWSDGILPLGTVLLLHGAGNPVHHIRLAWPPSLHAVLGIFPWIRLLYNILFHVAQYRLPLRVLKNSSSGDGGRDSTMSRSDIRLLVGDHQRYIGVSIIGALLLPMIGTLIGSCLNYVRTVQQYFPDPLHRNLLGGCIYVVVKDMTSLLFDCELIRQRRSRRIQNVDEIPPDMTRNCG